MSEQWCTWALGEQLQSISHSNGSNVIACRRARCELSPQFPFSAIGASALIAPHAVTGHFTTATLLSSCKISLALAQSFWENFHQMNVRSAPNAAITISNQ